MCPRTPSPNRPSRRSRCRRHDHHSGTALLGPTARVGKPTPKPVGTEPCSSAWRISFVSPTFATRSSSRSASSASTRRGPTSRFPGVTWSRVLELESKAGAQWRARLSQPLLGWRAHQTGGLRTRRHALHHELDRDPTADDRDPRGSPSGAIREPSAKRRSPRRRVI